MNFRTPYRLTDTIEIIETPGHTLSCVSVLVRASNLAPTGLVVIVGDLFERHQDIADERLWLDAGSENPTAQRRNRAKLAMLADVIIPGHGAPFPVDQQLRASLSSQVPQGED
ncbi:metallo-beta-lactamase domain-containing protein 1-like [Topomyia yanbarensis]|uniref:metallo-beta-lactamase domain-containing protein 1-like n=1 Tax=Topomyia yanbarensis TaxID=2498891 RepID=UPI00273B2DC6|nr:metallo-beta-lactamase domain-containing protein 1-like [Topomyia yanbarensis]